VFIAFSFAFVRVGPDDDGPRRRRRVGAFTPNAHPLDGKTIADEWRGMTTRDGDAARSRSFLSSLRVPCRLRAADFLLITLIIEYDHFC
jgi:hypothetical protein